MIDLESRPRDMTLDLKTFTEKLSERLKRQRGLAGDGTSL
jgi:hypothetical protein